MRRTTQRNVSQGGGGVINPLNSVETSGYGDKGKTKRESERAEFKLKLGVGVFLVLFLFCGRCFALDVNIVNQSKAPILLADGFSTHFVIPVGQSCLGSLDVGEPSITYELHSTGPTGETLVTSFDLSGFTNANEIEVLVFSTDLLADNVAGFCQVRETKTSFLDRVDVAVFKKSFWWGIGTVLIAFAIKFSYRFRPRGYSTMSTE